MSGDRPLGRLDSFERQVARNAAKSIGQFAESLPALEFGMRTLQELLTAATSDPPDEAFIRGLVDSDGDGMEKARRALGQLDLETLSLALAAAGPIIAKLLGANHR